MKLATVVPAMDKDGNPSLAVMGTKVVLESGEHLPGVLGITITADDPNGVWEATIRCHVLLDKKGLKVKPTIEEVG